MSAQTRFAQAVQDPARALPQGLTSKGGRNDPLRFAVYRNNVHVSLVTALTKGLPVVRALVGEEFFTAMARVFVGQTKPSSPMLFQYGENFPDFIAEFPPAASLPYLSDVARLECAWTRAYHAADDPVLTVDALADLQPSDLLQSRLALHPACALINSRFPVGSIWHAHRQTPPAALGSAGPETVLIARPALDVVVTVLPQEDAEFARAIMSGATVGDAATASANDADFDLGTALVGLISLGAFKPSKGNKA